MFHGTLTTKMHCNWPQLTVQQMVNEAWLFTFCHWTHGCDVNVVKNYLNSSLEKWNFCFFSFSSFTIDFKICLYARCFDISHCPPWHILTTLCQFFKTCSFQFSALPPASVTIETFNSIVETLCEVRLIWHLFHFPSGFFSWGNLDLEPGRLILKTNTRLAKTEEGRCVCCEEYLFKIDAWNMLSVFRGQTMHRQTDRHRF